MQHSTQNILAPMLPESVADATVTNWFKNVGDEVKRGDVLVEIETDKVTLEVEAQQDGVLSEILEKVDATVVSEQLLGKITVGDVAEVADTAQTPAPAQQTAQEHTSTEEVHSPAIRRLLAAHNLDAKDIESTGVGGRITREDIDVYLAKQAQANSANVAEKSTASTSNTSQVMGLREDKRVPMSRLRQRIAERLLDAKNNTAMLTTFNEVDMLPIKNLRKQYGERFEKAHGVRLGFMSFYVKAIVEALKQFPVINASVDGTDVVYHNYFDISIAVSTPKGLVTPVLRDCDQKSMAEIEKEIKALAIKGRDGKLTVEDLTGGTFTLTNGGVFGSLMSTPIINPPQSAILGMHAIKERPIALDGQVVIRPMMYIALSYDHRLIDGKDSVSFLVKVKELLEDPARILLSV